MPKTQKRAPAMTAEARENQLINMAYNLAEEQLANKTATSQVITHFLKRGTLREQIELKKLERDIALSNKKMEVMESQKRSEEIAKEALRAFRSYTGMDEEDDDEYDEE